MAGKNDRLIVGWADGTRRNFAKSKNQQGQWGALKAKLSKPKITDEKRSAFDKMSKDEQDELKSAAGWISGAQIRGQHRSLKNVLPRDLLTIDIDYPRPGLLDDIVNRRMPGFSELEGFWHSSRRHTPDEPRVRLFMPMSRKVDLDEYQAIVRQVAFMIDSDMKTVDKVSFRPAQMMFLPTCSVDDAKNYFTFEQVGELLNPDEILATFDSLYGDWRDWRNWHKHAEEKDFRKRADRAEDPRQKNGIVGEFCRAFTISEAMEHFIPDTYIPAEGGTEGNPRFTYRGATSSGGAVIYDNDTFLYSHHGSDPLCDMNVNAFDMVRIHLFGDEDARAKPDTAPTKMPSFVEMREFILRDSTFRKARRDEKFAGLREGFEGVEEAFDDSEIDIDDLVGDIPEPEDWDDLVGEVPPAADESEDWDDLVGEAPKESARRDRPKPSKPNKRRTDYRDLLEFTDEDEIKATLPNVAILIQHDERTHNVIRLNEFTKQIVFTRDLSAKVPAAPDTLRCLDPVNGVRWEDGHDYTIRAILETANGDNVRGYGMRVAERDIQAGLVLAARQSPFHPIRDYLLGLKWDGKRRVEKLLIDYLGAPDTAYHREVAKLMLVASVTRVFHPGHKFDFACIIEGDQGIRKSTFVQTLYSESWFGEIRCDLSDKQKIAEEIAGIWGAELPELSALGKSDFNAAKAFMRATKDDVRMAYERRVGEFPRQAVFWGTTNEEVYLRDPTGNRSWWPVKATVSTIDTDRLEAERDQLWAEAFEIYWEMRGERPTGTLPLFLSSEATAEAVVKQNAARSEEVFESWFQHIMDWLDTPITLRQFREEMGIPMSASFDGPPDTIMVLRCVFTEDQAMALALRKPGGIVNDQASKINLNKVRPLFDKAGWRGGSERGGGIAKFRVGGVLGRYRIRRGATAEERQIGYRPVEPEEFNPDDLI